MLHKSTLMALGLDLKPDLHFSGSTVRGTVDIHLNEIRSQEITCVRVKLRGSLDTIVNQYTGYGVNPIPGHRDLVRQDLDLWTPASNLMPAQGDVLTLPFQFELPYDNALPPSNQTKHSLGQVCCRYKVEAVGDRHGILKRNRRLARAFPFLPDDIPGWRVKQQLDSGPWAGEWRIESAADQVRKVVFQEHAQVCAKLHLPAVDTYPMATAIPFKLELQTTTRPLKEKDVSKKEADDHLFPYPPDMSEIKFELKTRHRVKSDYKLKESWSKSEDLFKGNTSIQEIRVDPKTTQSGDKFFIEQSNTVTGNIILNTTAPGYTADLHIVQHELILKVPFSGLTNNLNITIPLEVTSGCSAQDVEHASYDMLPDYYDIADSDDESKGGDVKKYLGKLTGGS